MNPDWEPDTSNPCKREREVQAIEQAALALTKLASMGDRS